MQTFLPYADFYKSAKILDFRRLGKQRVECLQLLKGQWKNHPIAKMWKGFEYQLAEYGKAICLEWKSRGYKDTCYNKISELQKQFNDTGLPSWFGNEEFHKAHMSNLIRKKQEYYRELFPDVRDDIKYIYPH
jgi:hypothetical protein